MLVRFHRFLIFVKNVVGKTVKNYSQFFFCFLFVFHGFLFIFPLDPTRFVIKPFCLLNL
jgi:hypothetical protein